MRGIAIVPDESAEISDIGGDVDVEAAYVPELDISYFMTDQVTLELILATAPHDVMAIGTSAGDVDLGSVWLLPPTLTLQFHPAPDAQVSPYVGAGGNRRSSTMSMCPEYRHAGGLRHGVRFRPAGRVRHSAR